MMRASMALSLALSGAAGAQAPLPQQAQQEYLDAVRPLNAGRPQEAVPLLTRFIEKTPQHAGAWLDLAISECELGHAAEAERLFAEIAARFAPPPGILDMIRSYRARGCLRTFAPRRELALTLGRGHDSNVNQGASKRFFSIGSGSSLTEWELGADHLPQADYYTLLGGAYTHALDASGTLAFVQLRTLLHDTLVGQDRMTLMAGLERPWQAWGWRGRATAAFGMVRLGAQTYQRQAQLQLRAAPPLSLPQGMDWYWTGGLNHVQYPARGNYNASTLDLGTSLGYAWAPSPSQVPSQVPSPSQVLRNQSQSQVQSQVRLTLGALVDRGQVGRPGGHRHGWYGGLQLSAQASDKLSGELGWTRQRWLGQTAYAPGLIDLIRNEDTRQLRAAVLVALRPHQSMQLEWRQVSNRENISLFQYTSRVFQLSWRWDHS